MIEARLCSCGMTLRDRTQSTAMHRKACHGIAAPVLVESELGLLMLGSRVMPSGCREWQGYIHPHGYGITTANGRRYRVHRLAWELVHGPIPDGLHVCHHCDNKRCIQTDPDERYPTGHLFLGTNADNKADYARKGLGKGRPNPSATGDAHWKRRHPEWIRYGPRRPDRTECMRGHDITDPANRILIRRPSVGFICRTCRNVLRRARRAEAREARKNA